MNEIISSLFIIFLIFISTILVILLILTIKEQKRVRGSEKRAASVIKANNLMLIDRIERNRYAILELKKVNRNEKKNS